METKIKKIDLQQIDENAVGEAGRLIAEGELVAFPTETVYGLGADALRAEAAAKLYAVKGRPSDNPLIVHIAELGDLERIAFVPPEAKKLADAFWPGPLTLILKKKGAVPYTTTGGLDTVAVRMPNHPVALELIRRSGCLIAAPSANTSGRPSPTEATHVKEDLSGRIPMILDGGPVGIGIESTILDLTEEQPMILRPGYITQEMLAELLGREVGLDPGIMGDGGGRGPKAPGMKYRHYAPKAKLAVVTGPREAVTARINELVQRDQNIGKKVAVIASEETVECYDAAAVLCIGSREDEETIAQRLYRILRECDELKVGQIYSESFETPRLGQAIMNRLLKAAGHTMIHVS
ncbi:MAG: L-threonylcarbamoyladenylate synthase [Blautia sp.]|nr:L-threonylcarbamoyladenylate synthase [Blautia sp.]